MNTKKMNPPEWPSDLQKALDEYPRITASPDFNKRVLAALAAKQAKQSKLELFCDNLDRIFERPILKLLGTALFAILLAWGGSNVLLQFSGAAMPNANMPTIPFQAQTLDSLPPHLANLYAERAGFGLQFLPADNSPQSPSKKVLSIDKKETSCSPNETIMWG
ncbi:MAG: hypothetical protein ABI210_12945 [Abditibacteriaceae bacterium]